MSNVNIRNICAVSISNVNVRNISICNINIRNISMSNVNIRNLHKDIHIRSMSISKTCTLAI